MGGNAVVTDEECDTGIACDGLAMSTCPDLVTSDPVTESPAITKPNPPVSEVTFDPTATNVVSVDPEIITTSGTKLKTFGAIIAVLVMFI